MSLQDPAEREYLACIVEELRYGEARGQELVAACRSNPALLAWDEALAVQALDEERHRAQLVALAATAEINYRAIARGPRASQRRARSRWSASASRRVTTQN